MANNKTGFTYYSVDTDRYQDRRIKRLKKAFKCIGLSVYDYILCEIYRVQGCFLEWDANTAFDVAEYFDLKEATVNEIVNYCCVVGLFNKELLTSERVLTSHSIQTRFADMCKRSKRAKILIPKIINLIPEESMETPEESQETPEESPQKKVKYKKEKEEIPPIPPACAYEEQFPPDVFEKSLPDCYNMLVTDQIWWEGVCMNNHITAEQFIVKLQEFFRKLQNEGEKQKSARDGQSHFARWLAIDIQKQKSGRSNSTQKKGKIEELKEVGDSSLEIARKILNGNG